MKSAIRCLKYLIFLRFANFMLYLSGCYFAEMVRAVENSESGKQSSRYSKESLTAGIIQFLIICGMIYTFLSGLFLAIYLMILVIVVGLGHFFFLLSNKFSKSVREHVKQSLEQIGAFSIYK